MDGLPFLVQVSLSGALACGRRLSGSRALCLGRGDSCCRRRGGWESAVAGSGFRVGWRTVGGGGGVNFFFSGFLF